MDEELITEQAAGAQPPETDFYLGTVTNWSNADGVQIQLDGQDQAMTKRFKMMQIPRPIHIGERVIVMKQAGTYVVLGVLGMPNSWRRIPDLATTATTADIIEKINAILAWLRTQGILWT